MLSQQPQRLNMIGETPSSADLSADLDQPQLFAVPTERLASNPKSRRSSSAISPNLTVLSSPMGALRVNTQTQRQMPSSPQMSSLDASMGSPTMLQKQPPTSASSSRSPSLVTLAPNPDLSAMPTIASTQKITCSTCGRPGHRSNQFICPLKSVPTSQFFVVQSDHSKPEPQLLPLNQNSGGLGSMVDFSSESQTPIKEKEKEDQSSQMPDQQSTPKSRIVGLIQNILAGDENELGDFGPKDVEINFRQPYDQHQAHHHMLKGQVYSHSDSLSESPQAGSKKRKADSSVIQTLEKLAVLLQSPAILSSGIIPSVEHALNELVSNLEAIEAQTVFGVNGHDSAIYHEQSISHPQNQINAILQQQSAITQTESPTPFHVRTARTRQANHLQVKTHFDDVSPLLGASMHPPKDLFYSQSPAMLGSLEVPLDSASRSVPNIRSGNGNVLSSPTSLVQVSPLVQQLYQNQLRLQLNHVQEVSSFGLETPTSAVYQSTPHTLLSSETESQIYPHILTSPNWASISQMLSSNPVQSNIVLSNRIGSVADVKVNPSPRMIQPYEPHVTHTLRSLANTLAHDQWYLPK
eukprot:TRINITY_DN12952_c0_g1_i1.p1 TRINITY_DN12952_c0_g1~~TRINITY_DN12952_c0_g1_i1.p1  ORF type:complete len:579 (-),score=99.17 TRINITY_DN12952_c0_g1_i1:250-1986(-)